VLALFNARFSVSKIKVFHCTLSPFGALLAPKIIEAYQQETTTQKEHKRLRNLIYNIYIYATDGKLLGSQKAVNGTVSLSTSESIVICKIGETSIKISVK